MPIASVPFLLVLATAPDELDGRKSAVVRVGDANADGVPDIAVATGHSKPRVLVLSGVDGSPFLRLSPTESGEFGRAIAAAGDVDRDGHDDLLVAHGERPFTRHLRHDWHRGAAFVFSGRSGASLQEVRSRSEDPDDFGFSVAGGRDVNADGVPDYVVGAPGAAQGAGRADVFSGADGSLLWSVEAEELDAGSSARLAGPVSTRGVRWLGGAVALSPPDHGGRCSVLVGGQVVAGERSMAVVVAARRPSERARVLVVEPFAKRQGESRPWEIRTWNNIHLQKHRVLVTSVNDWWRLLSWPRWRRLRGESDDDGGMASDYSSADFVGDLTNDGIADFVTGDFEPFDGMWSTSTADRMRRANRGRWAVYCGASGTVLHEEFDPDGGIDVCGPGDVDGDGKDDVVLMMPLSGIARAVSGRNWETIWEVDLEDLRHADEEE